MRTIVASLFIFVALVSIPLSAKAQVSEEEFEAFANVVNSVINQTVNAATLFTSQETVSTGYFIFKSSAEQGPDTKLNVLRLPARLYFVEDESAEIRPFIRGQIAQLRATEQLPPFDGGPGQNDFSVIETYTFEIGGGADFKVAEGLVITPEASFAYSRIENDYDYNNAISQMLQPFLDREVFGFDVDVLTYSPKIKVAYTLPFEDVRAMISSRYSYLYNKSFSSTSEIFDVDSETGLFQNGAEARFPLGVSVGPSALSLRPFFVRSDIHGSAREGLGFDHFYETGFDLGFGTKELLGFINELTIGTSYTFADDFEGWRVGIGYNM